MSFGEQSLPSREWYKTNLMLSLHQMKKVEVIKSDDDKVRVYAEAGVTWKELIDQAEKHTGKRLIPFDTPSSDKISLAGSIASNTFARTSAVGGNYVTGHLNGFEWTSPTHSIFCSRINFSGDTGECFDVIPGSMGAGGVITAVDIDLRVLQPTEVVHTKVLGHFHNVHQFAGKFDKIARANRVTREWDQGFYAIIHQDGGGALCHPDGVQNG